MMAHQYFPDLAFRFATSISNFFEKEKVIYSTPVLKTSTPSMSSPLVYYVLLDSATGEPYKGASEDAVSLSSGSSVVQFRDAVFLKNPKKLCSVDASDLIVYKSKRSFENRNAAAVDENEKPLKASFPLDGLGETDEDDKILVVVVPPPTQNDLQADSKAVADFWTALRTYSGPVEANNVIQLPNTVFILGEPTIGSSIYIRPCYPLLLKESLKAVQTNESRNLIILGTPGIGKTYFGYFLLLYLARFKSTVVYETVLMRKVYVFTPDRVFIFKENSHDVDNYLKDPETFYIVDGQRPDYVNAKTILLSSFRKEIWYKFSNEGADIRHMPVWSRKEILNCRSLLYPELSEDLVKDLYSRWGGIARYVLKLATNTEKQEDLTNAIRESNIYSILQSIGGSGKKAEASSRLIHSLVTEDFHSGPYVFASEYVATEIYEHAYKDAREKLIRFISASDRMDPYGQLRGTMFENFAHTVLARGGSFKVRDLQTNEESTLELPGDLKFFKYSSNDDIQAARNHYFIPASKTFKSVDSFIKPNLLFQMTCAENHPCKQAGLRDVLNNILDHPSEPKLYFVVPPDRFATFTYQSYHGTNGQVLSEPGIFRCVRELSQFVLELPLVSQ